MSEDIHRRIELALDIAANYAGHAGEPHKAWVIDQMVRALLNCPVGTAHSCDFRGVQYLYQIQGENEAYKNWVAAIRDGHDGPDTYVWDHGVPP